MNKELKIVKLRMRKDEIINYTYVLIDFINLECVVIDPSWELKKIDDLILEHNLKIKAILLTHSHYDHVNLVEYLINLHETKVYMSKEEINYYNYYCKNLYELHDMQIIRFNNHNIYCISTQGHTKGSMCYLVNNFLFSGDTLFTEGCGRCDEVGGSPYEMYNSIQKIKSLINDDTIIYPGHVFLEQPGIKFKNMKSNIYLQILNKETFVKLRNMTNEKSMQFI
jgi:glyoxylase-like metal-dependent hydrolase (beta-lactamase superfamily II)